jgi:NADH dehydrogenase (ubiquinone) 1 alpha subcomplex subunit 6
LLLSSASNFFFSQTNRETPRVLTIYDIDTPLPEAKASIRAQFERYGNVKDERVVDMLVEKGYMDLEETLLQHKQRSHLLRNLSLNTEMLGSMRKRLGKDSTAEEQFNRGY